MYSPGLLFLIGTVSAFLGLCLALGITLVCTGVWLADGGGHG